MMPPQLSPNTSSNRSPNQDFEHVDLGFGHRHVLRPIICHTPRCFIAGRLSSAGTHARCCVVVKIVKRRVARHMPSARFVRASHGATVAGLANSQNGRSARGVTLQCCDFAFPLRIGRSRAQQALIAWRQNAGTSAGGQGRKPAEPVARSASLDRLTPGRHRSPKRSRPRESAGRRIQGARCTGSRRAL